MTDWVLEATRQAMHRVLSESGGNPGAAFQVDLRRAFIHAAEAIDPTLEFRSHQRYFSYLVSGGCGPIVLKFKYYAWRRRIDIDGRPIGYKSYSSLKNESEFSAAVSNLRTHVPSEIGDRRLVLVYQRAEPDFIHQGELLPKSSRCYDKSYRNLAPNEDIRAVDRFSVGPLETRILHVRPM